MLQLLEYVVPEAVEAAAEAARREARQVRLVRDLTGGIVAGGGGGYYGRSQRTRKNVDYTYNAYDDEIKSAVGF